MPGDPSHDNKSIPSDSELAAVIAAVSAFIQRRARKNEEGAVSEVPSDNWCRAGLLEGVEPGRRISAVNDLPKGRGWKTSLSLFALTLTLCAPAARAGELELRGLSDSSSTGLTCSGVQSSSEPKKSVSSEFSPISPGNSTTSVSGVRNEHVAVSSWATTDLSTEETGPIHVASGVPQPAPSRHLMSGRLPRPIQERTSSVAPAVGSIGDTRAPGEPTAAESDVSDLKATGPAVSGSATSGSIISASAIPAPTIPAPELAKPIFNGQMIKVAVEENVTRANVSAVDGARVYDAARGELVALLSPSSRWTMSASGANIALYPQRAIDPLLITLDKNVLAGFQPVANLSRAVPLNDAARAALTNNVGGKLPPSLQVASLGAAAQSQNQSGLYPGINNGVIIVPTRGAADDSPPVFSINGRVYRGALWLRPTPVDGRSGVVVKSFNAINLVELEDYVASVLPSEMPRSWPLEALKAQAIAARSYVLASLGKNGSNGFDVRPGVSDQVYKGVAQESEATCRAVRETAGMVIKHENMIVTAFFHSSSGGHTELSQHVWTKALGYLAAVPDFDADSKHFYWDRKFSSAELEKALGFKSGSLSGVFAVGRSPSRRVKQLMVIGEKDVKLVTGTECRQLLKLPSTNFNVELVDGGYVFRGQGFGHGLGMSQWGARRLAEHGYNAAQILKYYYKDINLDYLRAPQSL